MCLSQLRGDDIDEQLVESEVKDPRRAINLPSWSELERVKSGLARSTARWF